MNWWEPIGPPPSLPPAPVPEPPLPVVFSGARQEFVGLAGRGAMLEFITLGFYRFWLATDIRRHLWSNTHIDGDAPEYTGRGKELLIGFLFALAILVPVYLGYFLIGIEAERLKTFASIPLFLFFYLFGQFALYRARRYRLTRTVWRGVRFWMGGSGWAYAARAAWWTTLAIVTLGLVLPWRAAALERYKMRHCYYGALQGSFEGRGWEFFKRGWWLWLLVVTMMVGPPVANDVTHFLEAPATDATAKWRSFLPLLVLPTLPFVYAAFKAIEWRWWLSGIRFGEVRFESTLRRGALVGLYWKVIGWLLLAAALLAGYVLLCVWSIAAINHLSMADLVRSGRLQGHVLMFVLGGIGYLAFILVVNFVLRVYLLRDLWMRIAGSATLLHAEAVADVFADGELASAVGEGLADSLDVVGF